MGSNWIKFNIMKVNISRADRIVRILLAIIANILYVTKTVEGVLGIIVLLFGGIMLITALVNFCPIYKVCKISSKKD